MKPLTEKDEWNVKISIKREVYESMKIKPSKENWVYKKEDVLSALELFEDKLIRLGNKNAGITKVGDVFNILDECFQIMEVKGR